MANHCHHQQALHELPPTLWLSFWPNAINDGARNDPGRQIPPARRKQDNHRNNRSVKKSSRRAWQQDTESRKGLKRVDKTPAAHKSAAVRSRLVPAHTQVADIPQAVRTSAWSRRRHLHKLAATRRGLPFAPPLVLLLPPFSCAGPASR